MTGDGAKAKPAAHVRLRIVVGEERFAVAGVLNVLAIRDDPNLLRSIGFEQKLRGAQIVLGEQWTVARLPDVASKAGGSVGIAPQPDIVAPQHIVAGKGPVALDFTRVVLAHPEAVQITHPIIQTAFRNGHRLVLNYQRANKLMAKPDRAATRHVYAQLSIPCCHASTRLKLGQPVLCVLEIISVHLGLTVPVFGVGRQAAPSANTPR